MLAPYTGQTVIRECSLFDTDTAVFLWLNATSASPSWLLALARFASRELPPLMIAGTAGAFIVGGARVRRAVLRITLAMALAWILARVGQHYWPMPRPFVLGLGTPWISHNDSPSFPSTHASVAFAFSVALALASGRKWAAAGALALALLVAWSRVCLGLHFPFDVGVGAVVGGVSGWTSGWMPARWPRMRTVHD